MAKLAKAYVLGQPFASHRAAARMSQAAEIAIHKAAREGWMRAAVFYKDIDAEADPEVIAEANRRWPLAASK